MVEIMTVEDIAGWDEDLRALTDGLGWLFNRPEPQVTFGLLVRGLLADVAKKNSWGLAEHLGLARQQPLEHLLGGARWDADVLRGLGPGRHAGCGVGAAFRRCRQQGPAVLRLGRAHGHGQRPATRRRVRTHPADPPNTHPE